jgi:ABC-type enterobactin transport system permease subunit
VTISNAAKENPNATLAAGSTSVAVVAIYLLGQAGYTLTPEIAAAVSGIITSLLLYIGHNGVKGFCRAIWNGSGGRLG